jgi:hypothetical protein
MVFGSFEEGAFDIAPPLIVIGDERKIHCEALVHRGIGEALGDPVSVGAVGNGFADGREGLLAVGLSDMGQECAAFAGQRHPSTQQVAGRTPLGGIDRGLRKHPAAQPYGDFLGVDLLVFGLAAILALPPGMAFMERACPRTKGLPGSAQRSASQVPGKQAFGRQDELLAVGGNGLEKRLWGGGHVPVQQRCTRLVEEANVHGAGVESETTVTWVLCGVEPHKVSSSW